ncbi:MAG TPA: c-type cytochrome [Candidatus Limnocylindria bacterium]|jgi:mono/diheme cytochrome c family protein|nr:c-type cytochrome [Candidatus Limnocylindria bacterium]
MDLNVILAAASLLLFVGLLAYFGFVAYHQQQIEPEEKPATGVELLRQHYAPGDTVEQPTPYWVAPIPAAPDPLEISGNLDRKIVAGGVMLFALFGLVGGYLLLQMIPQGPLSLRAAAAEKQLETSIVRGKNLYANFCYPCHGKQGLGNGETDKDGKPLPGKPLNKPDFKYETLKEDPAKLKDTENFIRLRITRGKPNPAPNYSMPAWGQSEGGPFNPEQVTQLVNFIMHGTEQDWADIVTLRVHMEGVENADVVAPPPPAKPTGAEAAQVYCTTCHSFTVGTTSPVPTAPNLGDYGVKGPLNDENKRAKASGDPDWLFKWVSNAPKIKPGVIMPVWLDREGGSLDEETIRSIVKYLEGLGK